MPRFLVDHFEGMGSIRWLVEAPSPEAISDLIAEVRVIPREKWPPGLTEDGVQPIDRGAGRIDQYRLDVVSLDALPSEHPLAELRQIRERQRRDPLHSQLLDGRTVHARYTFDFGPPDGVVTSYLEVVPPDVRTRQVDIWEDGEPRRVPFPLNPPVDLSLPEAHFEQVDAGEFEELWTRAESG